MLKRKICIVTGSRAEYGLLYWLMKEIQEDSSLDLQIIATGMHLSPEFGLTYEAIIEDGFSIDAKVEMLLSSDTAVGISKSLGLGVIGFADALARLEPDIIVVLGDRFEILAAAQVALISRVPIAHISGGEVTEGAIDDSIRHAITKMALFHFVGAESYRKRVIQLGEAPERVINSGNVGLDNTKRLNLLSLAELEKQLKFSLEGGYFLVTYHPETLGKADPAEVMDELCAALDQFPDKKIIMTKSNADSGGRKLGEKVDSFAKLHPKQIYACASLGQLRYLSAMDHCDVVIGNSSSGIVEAPAMHKPTVNVGNRQSGRLKADSIIDCAEDRLSIQRAIEQALSSEFSSIVRNTRSLYGDCNASIRIKDFLKQADFSKQISKKFYDINNLE